MSIPFITSAGPVGTVGTLLRSSMRLEREQWLSPEVLGARRRKRLQRLLRHAAGTRYYGEMLKQANLENLGDVEVADLERLPLLDRQVMARYGAAVAWWRVVRADGRPVRGLEESALARLRAENTPLRGDRVDLRQARYDFDHDPRSVPGDAP